MPEPGISNEGTPGEVGGRGENSGGYENERVMKIYRDAVPDGRFCVKFGEVESTKLPSMSTPHEIKSNDVVPFYARRSA